MTETKVTFEYFPLFEDDPRPYRAHIVTAESDHHGMGKNNAEALLLAADHWLSYENKKASLAMIDAALAETEGG
jgi:hypothetical protein